jgi:hypothetical protein
LTRTIGHYRGVHAGTDYNKHLGLPGPTNPLVIGFPWFTISGCDQIGDSVGWPNAYTSTNYNTSDTVTWVKGSHLMKFGGDILRAQMFQSAAREGGGFFMAMRCAFLIGNETRNSVVIDNGQHRRVRTGIPTPTTLAEVIGRRPAQFFRR